MAGVVEDSSSKHLLGRILGGFQDQVARRLTGGLPWRRMDGMWNYTLAEAAREEARFELIGTYVQQS